MAQDTSGIRALLSIPAVYDFAQTVMGARANRIWLQQEFIRAQPGDRVLDVGCGTADILSVMPRVDYTGFDISKSYIGKARKRWGELGQFHAQLLNDEIIQGLDKFDLILATGLLHHLDDDEVHNLFEALGKGLKPTGRIVTVDGTFVDGQNPIARFIVKQDRGKSIRTPEGYADLARSHFSSVTGHLVERPWIPYTYWIMQIGNG
jgi:SAM-dependent methyltransferase